MIGLERLRKEREGLSLQCRNGNKGVVKNYHRYSNVEVVWEDGLVTNHSWNTIKSEKGFFRSKAEGDKHKSDRVKASSVGSVVKTKSGWTLEVLEYIDTFNVKVRWQDGSVLWTNYSDIKSKSLLPLNKPSVYGVGRFGEGVYVPRNREPREGQKVTPKAVYSSWQQLLKRMYSNNEFDLKNSERYSHITMCEEWKTFQNFCHWAVGQVGFDSKDGGGRSWCLDKDILLEGNTVYSPRTCVFVPNEVNAFFTIVDNNLKEYGTNFITPPTIGSKDGYIARCTNPITKEREYLGYFDTSEQANKAYAKRKDEFARLLADKWEGLLDDRVIEALRDFNTMRRVSAVLKSRQP